MNPSVNQTSLFSRRQFIKTSAVALAAARPVAIRICAAPADQRMYRAVIIGHTGAGNYGHGLDLIFKLIVDGQEEYILAGSFVA